MFSQAYLLDIDLFRHINGVWTNAVLDWLMALISDFGFWFWPLLGIAALLAWRGRGRERFLLLLVGLSLVIGDCGIIQLVRHEVNRPRPWQSLDNVRYVTLSGVEMRNAGPYVKGRSFPSAHVSNVTAVAYFLTRLYPPWGALSWILVFLMAYSRVYTGSHFPSDVLFSIPLTLAYASLIYCIMRFLQRKYWPRSRESTEK